MAAVMRRLTLATVAAVVVFAVGGCTAAGNRPADPVPSASSSPEPSASSQPGVAPATGPEITMELTTGTMTLRAPDDYYIIDEIIGPDRSTVYSTVGFHTAVTLEIERDGVYGNADLNAFAAKRQGLPITSGEPLERLPDVDVDGYTFYQLAGADPAYEEWLHEFAARYEGNDIFISLRSELDVPQAERDAINASVLASVTLP